MADIEIVINKISLDLKKNGIQATVHTKKGDIQSRAIVITFRTDGSNYRVANGVTATIRAKKPDGTVIYNAATVQDGKVYFLLTSQYCAVAGKYTGEVQLIKSGKVLYTPKFAINVEDNIYDDSEIESTNEYTQLTEAIEDAQEALETAQALQLIKYVTDLDDPGDDKYLYVLEEKEPYFTMDDFPTSVSCATIFESTSSVYPFLAFTGMAIRNRKISNPGAIEFFTFEDDPSATGNHTSLFGYSAATKKWINLYDFDYYGPHALSDGDELILTDEATGTHSPIITDYVIKSSPLYDIDTNSGAVYIYENSLYTGTYYVQTASSEYIALNETCNVIDLNDMPEILTNPTGIPYVYDEVTNQYVALLDATASSLLERMAAAENDIDDLEDDVSELTTRITTAEGDIGDLKFAVLITHSSSGISISKNYSQIYSAWSEQSNFKVRINYHPNNPFVKYYEGAITNITSNYILFRFDISTETKTHILTYKLTSSNVLTLDKEEELTNQAKLTAGNNITIDNTDPKNPVISSTGGGSGSTYTAGNGIDITNDTISTKAKTNGGIIVDSDGISVDTTAIQSKLTAGSNITISGNTISATNTTYSAGDGISISDGVISVNYPNGDNIEY